MRVRNNYVLLAVFLLWVQLHIVMYLLDRLPIFDPRPFLFDLPGGA